MSDRDDPALLLITTCVQEVALSKTAYLLLLALLAPTNASAQPATPQSASPDSAVVRPFAHVDLGIEYLVSPGVLRPTVAFEAWGGFHVDRMFFVAGGFGLRGMRFADLSKLTSPADAAGSADKIFFEQSRLNLLSVAEIPLLTFAHLIAGLVTARGPHHSKPPEALPGGEDSLRTASHRTQTGQPEASMILGVPSGMYPSGGRPALFVRGEAALYPNTDSARAQSGSGGWLNEGAVYVGLHSEGTRSGVRMMAGVGVNNRLDRGYIRRDILRLNLRTETYLSCRVRKRPTLCFFAVQFEEPFKSDSLNFRLSDGSITTRAPDRGITARFGMALQFP